MRVFIRVNGKNITLKTPRNPKYSNIDIDVRKKVVVIKVLKVKNFKTIKNTINGNKLISSKITLEKYRKNKNVIKKKEDEKSQEDKNR